MIVSSRPVPKGIVAPGRTPPLQEVVAPALDSVSLQGDAPDPLAFRLRPGGAVVHGHLASDPQHAAYPSTHYTIRSFMSTADGQVAALDFRELQKALPDSGFPSRRLNVTQSQIDGAVTSTTQDRQRRLGALPQLERGARVTPKDGSLNPTSYGMFLRGTNDVSAYYAEQLSRIGQIEGFHIVAGSSQPEQAARFFQDAKASNVSILSSPLGEAWTEDYGEPTLGGGRVVPALFDDPQAKDTVAWIGEGRRQRYAPVGLDGDFTYSGSVNQGKFQRYNLAQGLAAGQPSRQSLSYLEGGNIYSGTLSSGTGYLLVGKDSFHLTRRLLEKQTGHPWSEAEVTATIAADMGVEAKDVHPVEQPGTFHLDMRMTAIAPGHMLLNDSLAAAQQQIDWMQKDLADRKDLNLEQRLSATQTMLKQTSSIMEHARKMARYEAMAAADLEKSGFTVHRLGGVFVDPNRPDRDQTNFFNARHGTNENGERFAIFMGGSPRQEAFIAQQMLSMAPGQISRVHFLDPSLTGPTLSLLGGLKCRTKPEGELISQQLLNQPAKGLLIA